MGKMSAIENSVLYTGENIDELIFFLKSLDKDEDKLEIKLKDITSQYSIIFNTEMSIFLRNDIDNSTINLPFIQLKNDLDIRNEKIKINTIFKKISKEKDSPDLDSDDSDIASGEDAIDDDSPNITEDDSLENLSDDDLGEEFYIDEAENISGMEITVVSENISEEIIEKKEALSKWEQKLTESENRES